MFLADRVRSLLGSHFEPAAEAMLTRAHEGKRVLNFVWLSKSPQSPTDTDFPIPDKYMANMARAAAANPDANVLLWVDAEQMSKATLERMNWINTASPIRNIGVRDLRGILEYNIDPAFRKNRKGFRDSDDLIWQKVDLARIVVVDHLFKTTDVEEVFYCDFDLVAPRMSSPEIQDILDRHGMVMARDNRHHVMLENQFMGFRRSEEDFVAKDLLLSTKAEVRRGGNGWYALCLCVHNHLHNGDPDWINSVTVNTLEV